MTENGRNPSIAVIEAAQRVLGGIDLDPASDALANQAIRAKTYYTAEQNGFHKHWTDRTVWLNPPGETQSHGVTIYPSHWAKKLYLRWQWDDVGHAIYLSYHDESVDYLGIEFFSETLVCISFVEAESYEINRSPRINSYRAEGDRRASETNNMQGLEIFLLSYDTEIRTRFKQEVSRFGAVVEVAS